MLAATMLEAATAVFLNRLKLTIPVTPPLAIDVSKRDPLFI